MSYSRQTWNDRSSEYPNRRTLTNVNDPSDIKTYDITRAEGTVAVEGSPLNADAMNGLEGRLEAMNTSLVGSALTVTLPAASWDPSSHLITISVLGVTAASNNYIFGLPATSAANIQNNKALQACNLMDYSQASGSITLYAENVPDVDLQIRIIVIS